MNRDRIINRVKTAFILIGAVVFLIGVTATVYSAYYFSKVIVTPEIRETGLVDILTTNAFVTMSWSVIVAEAFLFFLFRFIVSEHKDIDDKCEVHRDHD